MVVGVRPPEEVRFRDARLGETPRGEGGREGRREDKLNVSGTKGLHTMPKSTFPVIPPSLLPTFPPSLLLTKHHPSR